MRGVAGETPFYKKGISPGPFLKKFKTEEYWYVSFSRKADCKFQLSLTGTCFTLEFDARAMSVSRWKTERRSVFENMVNERTGSV